MLEALVYKNFPWLGSGSKVSSSFPLYRESSASCPQPPPLHIDLVGSHSYSHLCFYSLRSPYFACWCSLPTWSKYQSQTRGGEHRALSFRMPPRPTCSAGWYRKHHLGKYCLIYTCLRKSQDFWIHQISRCVGVSGLTHPRDVGEVQNFDEGLTSLRHRTRNPYVEKTYIHDILVHFTAVQALKSVGWSLATHEIWMPAALQEFNIPEVPERIFISQDMELWSYSFCQRTRVVKFG